MGLRSNIAFLVFNRPDCTRRVWERIRDARPPVLLVVADGPRNDAERVRCEAVRNIVAQVDWPCRVMRNYSDVNLGCKGRVSSGLNWVFEQVEEAIILEDDCLPDPSFFAFCEELLERYRHDETVMHIGGNNFLRGKIKIRDSYYFSKYSFIWGWASWRRAWKHYDLIMADWPAFRDAGRLSEVCDSREEYRYWSAVFEKMHAGEVDTWDYAWLFTCWTHKGMAIVPAVNMVSNIGAGPDATHVENDAWYMNLPSSAVTDVVHPRAIGRHIVADRATFQEFFRPDKRTWFRKTAAKALSPWTYGAIMRKVPVLGSWWGRWRASRQGIGQRNEAGE